MKAYREIGQLTAALLVVSLLLTACGGSQVTAATMRLKRTEGAVGVFDSIGQYLSPKTNLGLYSGYAVGTQAESYAWVDLDDSGINDILEQLLQGPEEEEGGEQQPGSSDVLAADPNSYIQRTVLDTGNYPVEIYYEIPVFPEEAGAGIPRINKFFQDMMEPIDKDAANYIENAQMLQEQEFSYTIYEHWTAQVPTLTDKLACVDMSLEYWLGGAHPYYELYHYCFRTDTGEQLFLSDVADASPEDIRAYILSALDEQAVSFLQERQADEYSFYIEDGRLYAAFTYGEGGMGAMAVLDPVELPMGLKEEWR